MGSVGIDIPRDRKVEFDPQILRKNQTSISQDMENKIISMYAKGMSTSDIEEHIRVIYGLEISDTTVSRITDKVLPVAKEWQQRPLESVYDSLFKLLYLAMKDITKKWTGRRQDWSWIYAQLVIYYGDCLPE